MKTSLFLFISTALLSGCVTASDCASDGYSVGKRDGRFATYPQGDRYVRSCSAFDLQQYNAGYRDGLAERPNPVGF